jgi:hypothetical protein
MGDTMFTYRGVEFGTNLPQYDVDVLMEAMECHERGEPLPYLTEDVQMMFNGLVEYFEKHDSGSVPEHRRRRKKKKNQRRIKNQLRKKSKKKRGAAK